MKLYERIENNNFDEIDRNRAIELIEGGNGHLVYNENYFKLQKENEELKADNYELNNRITDLLENIPIQKIKDKIEELEEEKKYYYSQYKIEELNDKIQVLQELIEEREEK